MAPGKLVYEDGLVRCPLCGTPIYGTGVECLKPGEHFTFPEKVTVANIQMYRCKGAQTNGLRCRGVIGQDEMLRVTRMLMAGAAGR